MRKPLPKPSQEAAALLAIAKALDRIAAALAIMASPPMVLPPMAPLPQDEPKHDEP